MLFKMHNYRFPEWPGPLYKKLQKKSLAFQANCRNSSPSKLLGGRITQVGETPREGSQGRVEAVLISKFSLKSSFEVEVRCNHEGCE